MAGPLRFSKIVQELQRRLCRDASYIAFDTSRQPGPFTDNSGHLAFNLGVAGACYAIELAGEEVGNRETDNLFPSYDRDEFWRWAEGYVNTFNGTPHATGEMAALAQRDAEANLGLYRFMMGGLYAAH